MTASLIPIDWKLLDSHFAEQADKCKLCVVPSLSVEEAKICLKRQIAFSTEDAAL